MNEPSTELSSKDLKVLKGVYWSKVFPSSAVFLLLFFIIFVYSSFQDSFGWFFLVTTILSFGIGTVTFFALTKDLQSDLINRRFRLRKAKVEDKVYKLDYEPGSATVKLNFFSLLFFKRIFMREMTEKHIYYMLVDGERIDLEKNDFDKVEPGKEVNIRESVHAKVFLGVSL